MTIHLRIANELNVNVNQVEAAIVLLDGGATVPFISRYRKEATGGLSDTQLRQLEERLYYLRELEERRATIIASITEQNKLTPELAERLHGAEDKATLEDLYLPYKPKRRTKAQIAREAGLEPLALQLLSTPTNDPDTFAASFINEEMNVPTAQAALEGARHILMENFSEQSELLGQLREYVWDHGIIKSEVVKGKEQAGSKFSDYFTYEEAIKKIPSHRALALLRGQREEILRLQLTLLDDDTDRSIQRICQHVGVKDEGRAADAWLFETVNWTWRIKLALKIELELMTRLREQSDVEAINVFSNNLKHLLMAAPAGSRITMGLDPGLRTGVKVVVIDGTGKLLHYCTLFPHAPRHDWDASLSMLAKLCEQHRVDLISIGNGTASRETDKLVSDLKKRHAELKVTSIVVSEAGASVYSASELAAQEFPDLDVSYRGAVSIARRLQDPLAELVKIEPKAIGVGQYQHDVNQVKLSRSLQAVIEDCVNAVGVDVNTASPYLLAHVAGLNETVASNIVKLRDEQGAFKTRQDLKKVPRLGDKAFEQAAGFLRIINGNNPLDASAVHPEAYTVVEQILSTQALSIKDVMGNTALIKKIKPQEYVNDHFGLPTVVDILRELEKPGRDPRPEFKTAAFQEGINELTDLRPGMILEGVITNVTNFGAFVDIGVHQDGLVHKSVLADRFVQDPNEVVKVGDIVKAKVLEVDLPRKRIQLSLRLNAQKPQVEAPRDQKFTANKKQQASMTSKQELPGSKLSDVLLQALGRNK